MLANIIQGLAVLLFGWFVFIIWPPLAILVAAVALFVVGLLVEAKGVRRLLALKGAE